MCVLSSPADTNKEILREAFFTPCKGVDACLQHKQTNALYLPVEVLVILLDRLTNREIETSQNKWMDTEQRVNKWTDTETPFSSLFLKTVSIVIPTIVILVIVLLIIVISSHDDHTLTILTPHVFSHITNVH